MSSATEAYYDGTPQGFKAWSAAMLEFGRKQKEPLDKVLKGIIITPNTQSRSVLLPHMRKRMTKEWENATANEVDAWLLFMKIGQMHGKFDNTQLMVKSLQNLKEMKLSGYSGISEYRRHFRHFLDTHITAGEMLHTKVVRDKSVKATDFRELNKRNSASIDWGNVMGFHLFLAGLDTPEGIHYRETWLKKNETLTKIGPAGPNFFHEHAQEAEKDERLKKEQRSSPNPGRHFEVEFKA